MADVKIPKDAVCLAAFVPQEGTDIKTVKEGDVLTMLVLRRPAPYGDRHFLRRYLAPDLDGAIPKATVTTEVVTGNAQRQHVDNVCAELRDANGLNEYDFLAGGRIVDAHDMIRSVEKLLRGCGLL